MMVSKLKILNKNKVQLNLSKRKVKMQKRKLNSNEKPRTHMHNPILRLQKSVCNDEDTNNEF